MICELRNQTTAKPPKTRPRLTGSGIGVAKNCASRMFICASTLKGANGGKTGSNLSGKSAKSKDLDKKQIQVQHSEAAHGALEVV